MALFNLCAHVFPDHRSSPSKQNGRRPAPFILSGEEALAKKN